MEPSSVAGAPTVASTGPDLPVYCLSPAQRPLITRLLFAGAQVAWARVGVGWAAVQRPLEQQSPDTHSNFITLLSESTATLCHLPTDLPVCPENSRKLTWLGSQGRCAFLHTIWHCLRGGSCGRCLSVNSSQLSGTCCLPSTGCSRSCAVAPGPKRQPFKGSTGALRGGKRYCS